MAISRERLQELINEGGRIWCIDEDEIIPIFLFCVQPEIPDEEILKTFFETKEQAEWHLKYHATRTEELDLPMWEEFKKDYTGIFNSISFIGCDCEIYRLYFSIEGGNIYLDDYCDQSFSTYKEWKATEENYIKACDLCVKLFKEGI